MGRLVLHFQILRCIATLFAMAACGLLLAPEAAFSETAHSKRSAARKTPHKAVRKSASASHSTRARTHTAGRSKTRAGAIHTGVAAKVRTTAKHRRRVRHFYNPWTEPTYADSTSGDDVGADDPVVRKAAVDALGPYNGTVVVADPQTGRILTIVNQKLGLTGAFQPCSTVKVMVSFASLSEGVVEPSTKVRLTRRTSIDLTKALAMSNNQYFAKLGQELGFERVQKYAKLFGIGEKAGLNIEGEEPGYLAEAAPATGVGMMTRC